MSEPGGPISWEEYDRLMWEHEERPAKLQAALAGAIAIAKEFDRRNEANKAQLTEARAVLKLVEWANADHRNARLGSWCPRCLGIPPPHGTGHGPDCRLDKALG